MKTVILCGGQGTRIRGVNDNLPKPMIPVGPYPILWHIMKSYASYGYKDFILCLGYKGAEIKNFFLNYRAQISDFSIDFKNDREITFHSVHDEIDWNVTLVETGEGTLTGSRIKKIEPYIGEDENFMMTYGDGVCDIDISELTDFHTKHQKTLTISGVRPPGRFGELEHQSDGQIIEFNEKPQATGGRISGGYFVCKREIFKYLDETRDDETLETAPMQKVAKDGEMMMYQHDGFWQCMDTYRDYALLNELYANRSAPWIKEW